MSLTFKTGVDDPARFAHSKDVGPHFGLTPKKYQSGEVDYDGRISKFGDEGVRCALYEAAKRSGQTKRPTCFSRGIRSMICR